MDDILLGTSKYEELQSKYYMTQEMLYNKGRIIVPEDGTKIRSCPIFETTSR